MDRLKSLGNAVVPLVVLEIFKAIDSADKQEKQNANSNGTSNSG